MKIFRANKVFYLLVIITILFGFSGASEIINKDQPKKGDYIFPLNKEETIIADFTVFKSGVLQTDRGSANLFFFH